MIFDIENVVESVPPDYLVQIVLSRRLRLTDGIGWFDKRNIGILLHNTGAEGAWSFSNKIREIITAEGPPPDCSVYSYPSDNLEVVAGISLKRKNERFIVSNQFNSFFALDASA